SRWEKRGRGGTEDERVKPLNGVQLVKVQCAVNSPLLGDANVRGNMIREALPLRGALASAPPPGFKVFRLPLPRGGSRLRLAPRDWRPPRSKRPPLPAELWDTQ